MLELVNRVRKLPSPGMVAAPQLLMACIGQKDRGRVNLLFSLSWNVNLSLPQTLDACGS